MMFSQFLPECDQTVHLAPKSVIAVAVTLRRSYGNTPAAIENGAALFRLCLMRKRLFYDCDGTESVYQ